MGVLGLWRVRSGMAGLLLVGGLIIAGGIEWLRPRPFGKVLLLGVFGIAGFATFYTLAIAYSAPGTAIVISSATPIISAVFAALVYRVPFQAGTRVAFLLAAIGAATSSLRREGAGYAFDFRRGPPLLLLAPLFF